MKILIKLLIFKKEKFMGKKTKQKFLQHLKKTFEILMMANIFNRFQRDF